MATNISLTTIGYVAAAFGVAALVAFISTPVVKSLAFRVGAVDDPKKDKDPGRRMHRNPIPRMGGMAIFLGFLLSLLIFVQMNNPMKGLLLGSIIIVILGIFDDIYDLPAKFKFLVQIIAAVVAMLSGNIITVLSNPNIFSANPVWELGWLSYPITVLWIVAITNAVNLIDGLDGLACGVSTISSMTMLVVALLVTETGEAVVMGALAGACLGFLPYNLNPAKIFMGDTGSTFLGFVLATVSVQGMFKLPMSITFVAPFLMLGLPIFDTACAFIRRIAHGQSPMHADRGHVHHRLIDMGFSQKQAVGILYVISAILGLSAVVLTTVGAMRAMLFLLAMGAAGLVAAKIFLSNNGGVKKKELPEESGPHGDKSHREEPKPEWKESDHG